ncbi:Leucine-rich repeat domain superfamily [Sesbania bispinosa]|nr:Leucine-rich repeat domain superfamily [Sesbania bispinosa]
MMMKRLRLLQFDNVKLTGDFQYVSKDLRWLYWHGFPLKYIPGNFYMKKLVAMDLKNNKLQLVWKEPQSLDRLKVLNLSHSHYLTRTPDFSGLPNLEKLILKDCPQLSKVHSTIGDLKYLILNTIHIAGTGNSSRSLVIQAGECNKATDTFTKNILQEWTSDGSSDSECSFPGDTRSKWLTFNGDSALVFKVPNNGSKLKGMTLRIIYSSSLVNLAPECVLLNVFNYTKNTTLSYKLDTTTSLKDEEWQGLMSNLEPGDEVEIVIVLGHRFTMTMRSSVPYQHQNSILPEPIKNWSSCFEMDLIISCGSTKVICDTPNQKSHPFFPSIHLRK